MKHLLSCLSLLAAACGVLEEDLSEHRIRIIGPLSGAAVPAGEVAFRWRAVEGAAHYEFSVVESSFAAVRRIVCDTLIAADTLGAARGYGLRATLAAGTYQWRVTAANGGYASVPAVQTLFVEEPPAPEQPADPEPPQTPAP
ncbi:hypothetical protein [Alistipes sp.]|mgnify:FL=1|uniref:hypothetical protein n=1 Tax=Alistipes sp. TaxID=1872444 RepID=UPI003A8ABA49